MLGASRMMAIIISIIALSGAACASAGAGAGEAGFAALPVQPAHRTASAPVQATVLANAALALAIDIEQADDAGASQPPILAARPATLGAVLKRTTPAQEALALSFQPAATRRPAIGPYAGAGAAEGFSARQISLSAPGAPIGLGVDLALAHRAGAQDGPGGRYEAAGAEVRLGQRLEGLAPEFQPPTWDKPAWYVFAASDGTALTWTPASEPADPNRALRLQEDRVEIGDIEAGFSVQAGNVQASVSYVERDVVTMDKIRASRSTEQTFTGLTVTWRR